MFGPPPSADAAPNGPGVIWREVGLDTPKGVKTGSFRYRVETGNAPGEWKTIVDRSESTEDFLVDHRECKPTRAGRAGW